MAAKDDAAEDLEQILDASAAWDVEKLIAANGRDIFGYFARRIVSIDDAADLTGEVFLILWKKSESLPTEPLAGRMWAFGVARNVLSNHRRTLQRRRKLEQRLADEHLQDSQPADLSHVVAEAISQLALIDREIVRLIHWDGFNLAEVASVLHRNPATVRSRYARARAKLASLLDIEGEAERNSAKENKE